MLVRHQIRTGRGFTLLELLVVVTLLGLVTSVVIVRSGVTHSRAIFEQAMTRFETIDARLRIQARRHGKAQETELLLKRPYVQIGDDKKHLGRRVMVDRFLSVARKTSSGRATIPYGVDGTSPTYSVRLAGPADATEWLLFAGETGQVTRFTREKDVQQILDQLR